MSNDHEEEMIRFVGAPSARLAVFAASGTRDDLVVLLHGGPGVPDYLAPVAALLATKHRVIRYDQRGTGRSIHHNGRFGLTEHLEDLETIRKVCGHERLGLFGHSWGGMLAQLYAQRHPERVSKMFLCDSGIGLGEEWRAMERAVTAHNRRRAGRGGFALMGLYSGDHGACRMMALVWRNYFDPPSSAPPPDESWLRGIRSKPMRETRKAVIEAEASRLEETELDPSTRVLVLFGKSDICGLTVERLFARYPEARHVVLEDAGHLPWVQSPETFRAELCTYFGC